MMTLLFLDESAVIRYLHEKRDKDPDT